MKHNLFSSETDNFLVIDIMTSELDMYNYSNLSSTMTNILNNTIKNYVIIDFKKVVYMDSSFISTLVNIQKDLNSNNKKLFLSSVNEEIIQIFKIINLYSFFNIKENKKNAFSSI